MGVSLLDRETRDVLGAEDEVIRLFDDSRAPLFRYLRWIGSSTEEADDAIQEAFLRLHAHLLAGGERQNLRAWVFRVAGNLVRDERKSGRRRFSRPLESEQHDRHSWADPAAGPEQRVLAGESERRLEVAIRRLPPDQQNCLALRSQGFRYREIAEILGVGTTTVADLLRRAVRKLSTELV
jgi:RNA polymerase sigma-70 factor (ECF subfamily)